MARLKRPRAQRINRIAAWRASRAERKGMGAMRRPFMRRERNPRPKVLIAYDLETTRIAKGTPRPLYLTAYGEAFQCSARVQSLEHLGEIVRARFLTLEHHGARFVAWNGNGFDVFLIALALLRGEDDLVIKPYLTKGKTLRGLRVETVEKFKDGKCKPRVRAWEFLDAMSMTGISGIGSTLESFLKTFAPNYTKLKAPNWAIEEFDARNPEHVQYAERDSEGLFHGVMAAQAITLEHFNLPLQPTIGNLGIKIFQAHIPMGKEVWAPPYDALIAIREFAMRGGFCHCVGKFSGPIWKYDLNQAYAAAMREAMLPAGSCIHSQTLNPYARIFIVRIEAMHASNRIPFYVRGEGFSSIFAERSIPDTWITSIEYDQLKREGWRINVKESFFWDDHFSMKGYVDLLESLRTKGADGKDDAQGVMMKYIGNGSYGKTVERLEGLELILANECPEGFSNYEGADDKLTNLWFRLGDPQFRDYHRPQIGAFITAHVRMVLRRAILKAPEAFRYADTDCAMFSRAVDLDIDMRRYGAWKVECEARPMLLITDKVYFDLETGMGHAKGMNIARLTPEAFKRWFAGESPIQLQTQRQNFLKVMGGAPMFIERERRGQIFEGA